MCYADQGVCDVGLHDRRTRSRKLAWRKWVPLRPCSAALAALRCAFCDVCSVWEPASLLSRCLRVWDMRASSAVALVCSSLRFLECSTCTLRGLPFAFRCPNMTTDLHQMAISRHGSAIRKDDRIHHQHSLACEPTDLLHNRATQQRYQEDEDEDEDDEKFSTYLPEIASVRSNGNRWEQVEAGYQGTMRVTFRYKVPSLCDSRLKEWQEGSDGVQGSPAGFVDEDLVDVQA